MNDAFSLELLLLICTHNFITEKPIKNACCDDTAKDTEVMLFSFVFQKSPDILNVSC